MGNFINRLTDMDWGWWPFLALRPAKNERMTSTRVVRMSLYFGSFYGALLYLALMMPRRDFQYADALLYLAVVIVFFFAFYRPTFAYAWNRRAQRLQAEQSDNSVAGRC